MDDMSELSDDEIELRYLLSDSMHDYTKSSYFTDDMSELSDDEIELRDLLSDSMHDYTKDMSVRIMSFMRVMKICLRWI